MVILEPENVEKILQGHYAVTQNKLIAITYTNDAMWLQDQLIANMNNLTPEILDRIIAESQKRPKKTGRPTHPPIQVIKDGKVQGGES